MIRRYINLQYRRCGRGHLLQHYGTRERPSSLFPFLSVCLFLSVYPERYLVSNGIPFRRNKARAHVIAIREYVDEKSNGTTSTAIDTVEPFLCLFTKMPRKFYRIRVQSRIDTLFISPLFFPRKTGSLRRRY